MKFAIFYSDDQDPTDIKNLDIELGIKDLVLRYQQDNDLENLLNWLDCEYNLENNELVPGNWIIMKCGELVVRTS